MIIYCFFLLDMAIQSRKQTDFYFWSIVLHLHKFGYFYLQEGKNLTYKISQYVNNNRYSTNPNPGQTPSLAEVNKVINLNLPVTLTPSMLHGDLARAYLIRLHLKLNQALFGYTKIKYY